MQDIDRDFEVKTEQFCVNCHHYYKPAENIDAVCGFYNKKDPVGSKVCYDLRGDVHKCGPNAAWFTPKSS